MKNIVISGYYGHNNFGDDAILKVIVSELKEHIISPHITVLSADPEKTQADYMVNAVYKYGFIKILSRIYNCDIFISGGGSLFQDVTSLKSLIYYLGLLFIAQILRKKTFIFAQGVGPLNSIIGKFLTNKALKKVDLITVRDQESKDLLESLGISSIVTADPVWSLRYPLETQPGHEKYHQVKLGIQLRSWPSLERENLNTLADLITSNFDLSNTSIQLVSLQDFQDKAVLKEFEQILKEKNPEAEVKLFSNLSIDKIIFLISQMDYIIAMRYHANLIAACNCVPALALTYDPKVENFARETRIPYISVDKINITELKILINQLISEKEKIKYDLSEISIEKARLSGKNISLMKELFFGSYGEKNKNGNQHFVGKK